MQIYGLQKLSMVDYPEKLAATVFTGGCNLRCPFCHNAGLVTQLDLAQLLSVQEVLDFLRSRRGLLDGVVLSGGEPLRQKDAAEFLGQVRKLGFCIKLDTNGCYPEALAKILAQGLVDYVAMDIKNSPEKYARTTGLPDFDLAPVQKSIQLLQQSKIAYEFRTTVVQGLHTTQDIIQIGQWLQGAPRYYLQNFVDSGNLIQPAGLQSFSALQLQAMAQAARPFFQQVEIRGI